ncbi:hypothetical protein [Vibrio cholerae]|uniref:hypothetical protein n=1 Tax=Vibrio cholerae TaxID=666 RepID=UPI001C30CDF2|nr:hypothetical protein [Vibrio cholerae]
MEYSTYVEKGTLLDKYLFNTNNVPIMDFIIDEVLTITSDLTLEPEILKCLREKLALVLSESLRSQLTLLTKHSQTTFQHLDSLLATFPNTDLRVRTWF